MISTKLCLQQKPIVTIPELIASFSAAFYEYQKYSCFIFVSLSQYLNNLHVYVPSGKKEVPGKRPDRQEMCKEDLKLANRNESGNDRNTNPHHLTLIAHLPNNKLQNINRNSQILTQLHKEIRTRAGVGMRQICAFPGDMITSTKRKHLGRVSLADLPWKTVVTTRQRFEIREEVAQE